MAVNDDSTVAVDQRTSEASVQHNSTAPVPQQFSLAHLVNCDAAHVDTLLFNMSSLSSLWQHHLIDGSKILFSTVSQKASFVGHEIYKTTAPTLQYAGHTINMLLVQVCGNQPWCIALLAIITLLVVQWCTSATLGALRAVQLHGLRSLLAHAALQLPILRGMVAREKQKIAIKLQADVRAASDDADDPPLETLPTKGMAPSAVRARIARKQRKCVQIDDGKSTMSGTVYIAGKVRTSLQ